MIRFGLLLLLSSCGPAVVPVVTTIGAIAGTVGTTEQLGITGLTDYLAMKKPVACKAVTP
jgi:hypothetical protein